MRNFFSNEQLNTEELRWLFRLFSPYAMRLLELTLLRCVIATVGIGSAVVNKRLVDLASAFLSVKGTILLTITCSCVSLLGGALLSCLSVRMTQRCAVRIRADLYTHLLDSVWSERTQVHSEDYLSRLTSDVERICDGVISAATGMVATTVQFCFAVALLYIFDRTIAGVTLLSVPLIAACSLGLGIYLKRIQLQVQKADAAYRVFLQEQLSHADVVKAFEQEQESKCALLTLLERKKKLILKSNRCSIGMRLGVSGAFTVTYLFALITGALKIAAGSITYGTMTAFLSLVNQVQSPVLSLSNILSQLIAVRASAIRIHEIADMQKEVHHRDLIKTADAVGIRVENLTFFYQPGQSILENLSFEIMPGSITAIMGHSGIGKTTLIRLLLGFLSAEKGSIVFTCGQTQYPCSTDTRKFISYVPQGNTLFSGTIADNLRFGCPTATEEQMQTALRMACADQFVQDLPEGLQTCIGENGHGLSEGQAQRIAIARAFLRPAPILLLDEATSSLDEETERKILNHLRSECSRRTCLFVSHRNTIAGFADQIIDLEIIW